MPRLVWSPAALDDVARLYAFLSAKNRDVAKRAVRAIRRSVAELQTHPEIGRPMIEMPPGFREQIIQFGHGAYLAMYHFDGQHIVVLAVRHGRERGY